MTKPLVSICCLTYNHAPYIRQALDSFLMQKTEFPFEIFVHDDASTDGTQDILLEYERRYPEKFRLILQQENQYSKDDKIMARFMFPQIESEFVAICEGDDYWTEETKLQRQVDWLRGNPDGALVVTSALTVNAAGEETGRIAPYDRDCEMPMEDLIRGGGGFIPTASIVTRTALLRTLPKFYYRAKVGDAPLQLYLASAGRSYWLHAPMCAYRVNAPGSWSVAQLMDDVAKPIAMHESMLDMLDGFDEYTGGQYRAPLETARTYHRFQIYRLLGDFRTLRQPEYQELFSTLTPRVKLRMLLMKHCPGLIRLYRKIRIRRGF